MRESGFSMMGFCNMAKQERLCYSIRHEKSLWIVR